ncbi:hypothetical protein DFJ73DRAFT_829294 [Zopfochytrium polystomum]|nr:hypothetical protein DFJ73DRAFT_829294 [Zopfochytrium polystomum]
MTSSDAALIKSCLDRLAQETARAASTPGSGLSSAAAKDLKAAIAKAVADFEAWKSLGGMGTTDSATATSAGGVSDSRAMSASTSAVSSTADSTHSTNAQLQKNPSALLNLAGNHFVVDDLWPPFKLGLNATMPVKIRETALDCLQRLIAHKLLTGSKPLPPIAFPVPSTAPSPSLMSSLIGRPSLEPNQNDLTSIDLDNSQSLAVSPNSSVTPEADPARILSNAGDAVQLFLIDDIAHTICTNYTGAARDELVQIHIIKVLLTAVTSTACEVHGTSLMKVVQTCINIYLHAKNPTYQATAKASLTQMINLILSRMENYSKYATETLLAAPADESSEMPRGAPAQDDANPPTTKLSDAEKVVQISAKEGVVGMLDDEVDVLSESMDSTQTAAQTLEGSTAVEVTGQNIKADVTLPNAYQPTVAFYNDLLRRDVYLIFRLLCRLSTKPETGSSLAVATFSAASVTAASSQPSDEFSPLVLKSRSLGLELLLSLLNNAGPVFQDGEPYADLIQDYLTSAISRNAFTTHSTLFELSLSIFLMAIRFYRAKLKAEVEVLLNTIYMHMLEMSNATFQQKLIILQGLEKICEDFQTLADLYLNYDCDLATLSLFERVVQVCGKVAQGKEINLPPPPMTLMGLAASAAGFSSQNDAHRSNEKILRRRALICLIALVCSLAERTAAFMPRQDNAGGALSEKSGEQSPARPADAAERMSLSSESILSGADSDMHDPTETSNTDRIESPPPPPLKTLQDILSVTAQSSPVIVNKHHLNSVTMAGPHTRTYSANSIDSPTGGSNGSHDGASSSEIEELATRKLALRQGIELFNRKPAKGIKFLIDRNFIAEDPESISKFLRSTSQLNKAAIGEYLGDGDPFLIKVMHTFIDSLRFVGFDFVSALRHLLQAFRLPGESQKVDRLMEKFADRYCEDNPGVFAKADTAYVLAFSIIMLNTDLHSSQIKNKMTKEEFIRNNRGINDSSNLEDEYLSDIFDVIAKDEIVMEEEQTGRLAEMAKGLTSGELNERLKKEMYRREVAQIQKKSQQLMTASDRNMTPFRPAVQPDLVRPMFATAAWPLMATFSLLFEASVDDEVDSLDGLSFGVLLEEGNDVKPKLSSELTMHDLCLLGFEGAIKVSSVFRMEVERDAFVTSLSKLTGLAKLNEIRPKHVKAIKVLIAIANSLGEFLESSWMQILKVFSQMERLQLIASNFDRPSRFSLESGRVTRGSFDTGSTAAEPETYRGSVRMTMDSGISPKDSLSRPKGQATASIKPGPVLERLIAEVSSQATVVAIDRIFASTTTLSVNAVLQFFAAACHVSLEEIGIDPKSALSFGNVAPSSPSTSLSPGPPAPEVQQPLPTPTRKQDGPPRMYLMQKIVETSYYNMNRIRFEWNQIWRVIGPYFHVVACHPDTAVASLAVDALRQLNVKYLEKEELGHFNTQQDFLKSFEWIMKQNNNPAIRELILNSLSQMISSRAASIRSGWKPIFTVLSRTTQPRELDDKLLVEAFDIVQMIFKESFSTVAHAGGLMDYVSCIAEFALLKSSSQTHDEVVVGSILLLQQCAKNLVDMADGELEERKPADSIRPSTLPPRAPSQPYLISTGTLGEDHFFLKWFPIISALSRVAINSDNLTTRTRCLETLFETLQAGRHLFSFKFWKTIVKNVISPIFDDLTEQYENAAEKHVEGFFPKEGSTALWIQCLRLTVELYTDSFTALSEEDGELVENLKEWLLSMLRRRDEKLATSGQICLNQFLRNNIGKPGIWTKAMELVEKAFVLTTPAELLNCDYVQFASPSPRAMPSNLSASTLNLTANLGAVSASVSADGMRAAKAIGDPVSLNNLDFGYTIIKCVTHVEIIQSIRDVLLTQLVRRVTVREPLEALTLSVPVPPAKDASIALAIILAPFQVRIRILEGLYTSYCIARAFNENFELRQAIWRRGLVQQMPNLVRQETISLSAHIQLLFAIYRVEGDPEEAESLELPHRTDEEAKAVERCVDLLVTNTIDVIERFVVLTADQQHNARDITLWSPVVIVIFRELLSMESWWQNHKADEILDEVEPAKGMDENEERVNGRGPSTATAVPKCLRLKRQLPKFFRLGIRMMSVERLDVRQVLQEFMERVGEELFSSAFFSV